MCDKQYVEKRKNTYFLVCKKKTDYKKIRGVTLVKNAGFTDYKNMDTYCSGCEKHNNNICQKRPPVMMTKIKNKTISRCVWLSNRFLIE